MPGFSAVNLVAGLINQFLFTLCYLFDDLLAGFQLRLPLCMTGNALFLFGNAITQCLLGDDC
ncbi:MAG: hypothetical protein WCL42_09175 [Chlorobiaceae bacterium]